ncbi:VanW family protein [Oryzihumus sp.]|uniref:VanW family protein n=1 Tax=Oryzihumus sp. TaxID=1968903 RepID=UPI002ED9CCEE
MREQEGAGRAVLRSGIALGVLAAAYLGLAVFLGRHVPAGTTVDGVPVGGMTPSQAAVTLKHALATKASMPVHLQVGDEVHDLDPSAAGLSLDVDSTLAGLTGFSLDPRDVWQHLTGSSAEPLRIQTDRTKLTDALTDLSRGVDQPVKEGSISFAGGKVSTVMSVQGRALNVDETARAVQQAWPRQAVIRAVVDVAQPRLGSAELADMVRTFATPALSAPVTVKAGARTVTLTPAQFSAALGVRAADSGQLSPVVDGARVLATLRAVDPKVEQAPVDASVVIRAGRPVVVPAVPGRRVDPSALGAAFLKALTAPARTAVVATSAAMPKVSTEAVTALGITSQISTFTTQFPFNPPRTTNITVAARALDGVIVRNGETFSLNGLLGQRTPAKGYQQAPVINGGRLEKDYGGGVSQVSTTLFNAVFFSGAKILEHTPHSFYIARYPEGREATVSWPGVDNRWQNDTGHAIYIQTQVTSGSITVSFYGTKVWDVEAVTGPRRNVRQPRTIVDGKPGCVPQSPTPGFDVTVTRVFKRGGVTVRTSQFITHYIPEDDVRCTYSQAG